MDHILTLTLDATSTRQAVAKLACVVDGEGEWCRGSAPQERWGHATCSLPQPSNAQVPMGVPQWYKAVARAHMAGLTGHGTPQGPYVIVLGQRAVGQRLKSALVGWCAASIVWAAGLPGRGRV